MARMRHSGSTTPVGRARAGLTRGVDPADRIKRWIGASARKRARHGTETVTAQATPSGEVITLTWAQTFGRPAKARPVAPPLVLKASGAAGSEPADRRAR
jgi:hypothetical protein